MNDFSWGALIGGMLVFLSQSFVWEWVKRLAWGPKLTLRFREDQFGVLLTREMMPDGTSLGAAHYVRVSVTNDGQETAIGCRGYVVAIEKIDDRGAKTQLLFDHIPLVWSYAKECIPVAIPADGRTIVNLDVLSTLTKVDFFWVRFATLPESYRNLGKDTGKYRFRIRVTADNASSKEIDLYFEWHGNWNDFRIGASPF